MMNSRKQQAIFDGWLREHAAILHHVANGFATGADRHDLMQELMLALWRAVPAFRAASLASTFIFRVTHNAALTWMRAERSYRRRLGCGPRELEAGFCRRQLFCSGRYNPCDRRRTCAR